MVIVIPQARLWENGFSGNLEIVRKNMAANSYRYLVATTTVWSGASYIYSKDAVKILNQKDESK